MKNLLLILTLAFVGLGFSQSAPEGETVLDTGFLSGGTVLGGVRYQVGNGLILDGSYTKPLIALSPLSFYSVTSVKGEVYDIVTGDLGVGAMTGFGFEYLGPELALFAEARLWAVYTYGVTPSLLPEIAIGFAAPIDTFLR